MIRIDNHCLEDLDQMAIDHYNFLNPTRSWMGMVNGVAMPRTRLGTHALISRINRAKINSQRLANALQVSFWDYFIDNQYVCLKQVISGRPSVLKGITQQLDARFGRNFLATRLNYNESSLTDFGKTVASVFNYETLYRAKEMCIDNVKRFEINCCPYCNVDTIEIISYPVAGSLDEQQKALLQLDHFYPQSRFPYLSLSFFNLIPGCSKCNAQQKLQKDFDVDTHFNPFEKSMHDHFQFSIDKLNPKEASEFTIGVSTTTGHSDQSLRDFRILERYNQNHKHTLFYTIDFMNQRRKGIVRSLVKQLPNLFTNFQEAENRAKKATGIPTSYTEINHTPLAKLKLDVCTQLGII